MSSNVTVPAVCVSVGANAERTTLAWTAPTGTGRVG